MKVFLAIGLATALAACDSGPKTLRIGGETMGTTYSVVAIDHGGEVNEEDLRAAIETTLAAVNATMSNWDPNSEVSRFNASMSTEPVEISPQFAAVMRAANDVHNKSQGRFDVTLGPLIELWGFGASEPDSSVPTDTAIADALTFVGQAELLALSTDPPALAKSRPEITIYLAAIAKGYGVDAVAETLRGVGISDYLVEIGGDLVTAGKKPDGNLWRIGIERPDTSDRTVEEVLDLSESGLATSGDYRNYFERDGIRYSHILDPQTGRPLTHTTASVTVVAENAMMADAWATALLVLGQDRGMALAERLDLAVLFIERDVTMSETAFVAIKNARFEELLAKE